jgi:hypothetical protein
MSSGAAVTNFRDNGAGCAFVHCLFSELRLCGPLLIRALMEETLREWSETSVALCPQRTALGPPSLVAGQLLQTF